MLIAETREPTGRERAILPSVWRIPAFVFGGFGFAALVTADTAGQDDWFVLGWICALPLVYSILLLRRAVAESATRALSDPFLVLLAAFALYFLFGTLLLALGPEDQATYALGWYPTSARRAIQITGMNLIGLATLLFAAGLFSFRFIEISAQSSISFLGKLKLPVLFWLFLILGVGAKYQVLAVDFADTGNVLVHGIYRTIAGLTQLAILIGVIYRGNNAFMFNCIAIIVGLADSALGLLLLNKSAALAPLAMISLGMYLRRPSAGRASFYFAFLIVFFVVIQRPISEARPLLAMSEDKDLIVRLAILEEVYSSPNSDDSGSGSWSRLCYVVAQVAAADLYDSGQGGEDAELLLWSFVPRALFPDKPIMTRSGTDFNYKITGTDSSSSGMGLFISGYFNAGWTGLLLVSISAGWIMAIFAAISRAIVASGSLILLPVGLLGAYMGFRIDGHFIADYLGPFGMFMVPLVVILLVLKLGQRQTI